MKLWLDDRRPAPAGWTRACTVADAQRYLGYTLCVWMEETGNWPRKQPVVHSNNAGAARMRAIIERAFTSIRK